MAVAVQSRPRGGRLAGAAARSPFTASLIACLILAALSAAVLPTVPSYDPWSWIVWGREVFDPHLSFTVGGGPSWKPLPVIFTAVYGLFGGAAPTLWVITSRAGGLMAFVAAYRLAARVLSSLGETPGRGWIVLGGVLAALGVALTQEFAYYMLRGTSEPLLLATTLWAVDRHLEGRSRSAFLLAIATSLMRPEAWPFTILYALWMWRRGGGGIRLGGWLMLGLLAIPFFWFVPPWIGTGQPFIAASHAHAYNGHLGSSPFVTVVHRGADLQVVPYLVFAIIALLTTFAGGASWRGRVPRLALGLGAAAAAWWVLVIGMTLDGYPGLERFFLPAAGIICVLGGAGLVSVARSSAAWAAGRGGRRLPAWLPIAAAAGFIVISIPFTTSRIADIRAARPIAAQAVTRLDQLSAAVSAVGGHAGVYPCRSSYAAVNHGVQTALAWKLHVTLERVGTAMRYPGVLFVGPHDSIDGGPAPINPYFNRIVFIKQVGVWKMYRVYRAGHPLSCVGS